MQRKSKNYKGGDDSNNKLTVTSQVVDDGDHVYLNLTMNNLTASPLQMKYSETRLAPLLAKPNDYYLTVARFNIPMNGVEIFDFLNDEYSVTLEYFDTGTATLYTSHQVILQYVQSFSPSSLNPNQIVGSYQLFIDSINNALALATTLLNAAVIAGGGVLPINANQPPYMTYNSQTLLCSVVAPTGFNPDMKLYFSNSLFDFFENFEYLSFGVLPSFDIQSSQTSGLPTITSAGLFNAGLVGYTVIGAGIPTNTYVLSFTNPSLMTLSANATTTTSQVLNFSLGTEVQILIKNNFNNTIEYGLGNPVDPVTGGVNPAYEMKQEYVSLYNWNLLNNVFFTSNAIPVRGEYAPSIVPGSTIQLNPNSLDSRQILTDFVPSVQQGPDLFSNLNYFPQGPYRLIDMVSDSPLTQIDLQAFYQDVYQLNHPLLLLPNTFASIKLLWIKKTAISKYMSF